jgi:DNA-binding FadR family transcriptional regulator
MMAGMAGQDGTLAERAYAGIVEIINRDQLQVGDRLPSE